MSTINVAGVTFANPDNESRQEILKNLGFGYHYAILQQTTFENERAVEVWVDSKLIGYIPRKELGNPMSYEAILIVQICYNEETDTFYAVLSPIRPLNFEQMNEISEFFKNHYPDKAIVFDKRAYEIMKYVLIPQL